MINTLQYQASDNPKPHQPCSVKLLTIKSIVYLCPDWHNSRTCALAVTSAEAGQVLAHRINKLQLWSGSWAPERQAYFTNHQVRPSLMIIAAGAWLTDTVRQAMEKGHIAPLPPRAGCDHPDPTCRQAMFRASKEILSCDCIHGRIDAACPVPAENVAPGPCNLRQ